MTRLRISTIGPILLADGRRAVLEMAVPTGFDENGVAHYIGYPEWQPVPIVEVEDEN